MITSEFRYYKCVKDFEIYRADDDGKVLLDEIPMTVEKGSVWEVQFVNGNPKWIAYQLQGYGRLMDFRKEHWEDEEYFEELPKSYYKDLMEVVEE